MRKGHQAQTSSEKLPSLLLLASAPTLPQYSVPCRSVFSTLAGHATHKMAVHDHSAGQSL